jgi:peptidoglycan/LPS O-acetylase OafA/YrhL
LLAEIFYNKKQPDSAYLYLTESVHLKDSLRSDEKMYAVQNLSFNETMRQQEMAAQKKKAEDDHVRNLQLLAIGIFIPVFFLVVLFLGRVKVRPRLIEFLGVLGLLLSFEFITDLIFPYISDWTNDSALWEMAILVLLAMLIEPLNHRMERWVRKHLVTTPGEPSGHGKHS